MKKQLIALSLLLVSGFGVAQHTQTTSTYGNDALFYEGKELFKSKNYLGAVLQLQNYKASTSKSISLEETEYLLAAAAFELKSPTAKIELNAFIQKYPTSLFLPQAHFLVGSIDFFNNRNRESIDQYKQVDETALDKLERDDMHYRMAYNCMTIDSADVAKKLFVELQHSSLTYRNAATYYTAWYNYKEKEFDRAIDGFESVKNIPEFSENARFYLIQIDFIRHNYDMVIQAGEAFYPKMRNVSNKAETVRMLGESYYHNGDTNKAIENLTNYATLDNNPLPSSMFILGKSFYDNNDYEKAINYLKFATISDNVLGQTAYYYLGCSYLKANDKKSARLAFESASNSTADKKIQELALYNYAMLIHETAYTGFNESVTVFERFLKQYPNSAYADRVSGYLSEVYMTSKNYPAALSSIQKIKNPSGEILTAKQRILYQMGAQYLIDGDVDNANKYLSEAIKLGSQDSEIYAEASYWRGDTNYRSGRFGDAASDFQNYTQMSAGNNKETLTLAYYNLGYALFKNKEISKARQAFERASNTGYKKNILMSADIFNRLGDCNYYLRDYNEAGKYFAKAAQTSEASADYALFQQAQILGIQKQYNAQIKILDKLRSDFPKSEFVDNALFQKAAAYENMEQRNEAINGYAELIHSYPNSSVASSAGVQLGMLFYANNNIEKSIEWYKFTISSFPNSDDANVANEDLKRIFKDQNRIGEYSKFIKSLSGKVNFSANEQDSLTYLGAEKAYMKGNKEQAESSLAEYLNEFPDGAFLLNANYYLGVIAMEKKEYKIASTYLQQVLNRPDNKFTNSALSNSADMAFDLGEFEKAVSLYKKLEPKLEIHKKRIEARLQMVRALWTLKKYNEVLEWANIIIEDPKTEAITKNETKYYRVKSNLALNKTASVMTDLAQLSLDTRNQFGAEAKYLLANYYFTNNNSKKAETEILNYIEKGTPHQHWLAKSFILLVDIYIKKGDLFEAKQYLLSLKSNYKEKDEEIDKLIEERLPLVEAASTTDPSK